jgi:esterase FrsA
LLFSLLLAGLGHANAQSNLGERTLGEVKDESLKRAESGMYPMIGLDPGGVRKAFQSITKMDNDEWAAAFVKVVL